VLHCALHSASTEERKAGIHIYSPEPLRSSPRNEHLPVNAAPGTSLPDAFKDRAGADVVAAHYREEQADIAATNARSSATSISGDNGTAAVPAAASGSSDAEAASDTARASITKCDSNGSWLEPSVTEGSSHGKRSNGLDNTADTSTE
jgi:hypothetical protein